MENYSNKSPGIEKPGMVTAITIMTLLNGIFNIFYALSISCSLVLGTIGFGLICLPLTILPAILGIFEIVYASQLLSIPTKAVKPSQTLAILEIIAVVSGNIISLVVGIMVLVFYNDLKVREYFRMINQ